MMESYAVLMQFSAVKTHKQGRAMDLITDWLIHIWDLLQVRGWWFAVGLVLCTIVGVLPLKAEGSKQKRIPFWPVVWGTLLPVCNFSVILPAVVLWRSGVQTGAVFAFLSAAVLLNPSGILSGWAYMGPELTAAWVISAAAVSVAAGMVGMHLVPMVKDAESERKPQSTLYNTFSTLAPELALWLVLGILAQALLQTLAPKDFWQTLLLNPTEASFGDAVAAGLFRHVCIPDDVALAASLVATGFQPGWAVLFLTVGICTNLPELFVLYGIAGKKAVVVYSVATVAASIAAGIMVQLLMGAGFVPQYSLAGTEQLVHLAGLMTVRTWMSARIPCALALAAFACRGVWLRRTV